MGKWAMRPAGLVLNSRRVASHFSFTPQGARLAAGTVEKSAATGAVGAVGCLKFMFKFLSECCRRVPAWFMFKFKSINQSKIS
jgi:hypothetical protein